MTLSHNQTGNACSESMLWQEHESLLMASQKGPGALITSPLPELILSSLLPPHRQATASSSLASHGLLISIHTHPCSRLHLTDEMELPIQELQPCTDYWQPQHCTEYTSLLPHPSPHYPAEQQCPSSVFKLVFSLSKKTKIKAAVSTGRQPSLFALESRWSHTGKDKMNRELLRKYIPSSISPRH